MWIVSFLFLSLTLSLSLFLSLYFFATFSLVSRKSNPSWDPELELGNSQQYRLRDQDYDKSLSPKMSSKQTKTEIELDDNTDEPGGRRLSNSQRQSNRNVSSTNTNSKSKFSINRVADDSIVWVCEFFKMWYSLLF